MGIVFMQKRQLLIAGIALSLAGFVCSSANGQKKPKITKVKPTPAAKKADTTQTAEPDKVLYDRAMTSVKHSKYIEARLDFQTLINTYPDSEYLAKAKLGVADSFYKEGGTSSLTQAVEEYKNFIVFFPFLDEAAYAQMQVGMAHYKMMEKADRDNSHAEAAEDEFRAFLLKYPQSPYVPQAEQSLRNVQEVLADGEFGIARFYYLKKDYRASAARLVEMTGRYPLYSQSDEALWMLGDVYQRAKQVSKNEDDKNHWADLAGKCYSRILQDYPMSDLAPGAKERLKAMGMPIPAPNPDALARMKQQQLYEKQHHQMAVLKFPKDMIRSGPDVSAAAHAGPPNLNPPDDLVSPMEVLNQNAAGPSFTIVTARAPAEGSGGGSGGRTTVDTESVETEPEPPAATPSTNGGVQILDEVKADSPTATAPAATSPVPAELPAGTPATDDSTAPAATSSTAAPAADASQAPTATPQAAPAPGTSSSTTAAQPAASPNDPSTESTSKKKKGLHKLIPF
jgi:outer membrane protein assembly factor BamD